MIKIQESINKLEKSPLFYLFASSKELFHSNFWYWLYRLNPNEAVKLFLNTDSNNISFEREYKRISLNNKTIKSQVDILITENKSPIIVIENKVKDFPTHKQLDRIINSFDNNSNITFILTSLFNYNEIKFEKWNIKTYLDISNSIESTKFTNNDYYRFLINDYKDFCLNLHLFANLLPINKIYDFSIYHNKKLFPILNKIKFWETFQKLRSSHLLHYFNKENIDIETVYSINNQKATLDFIYPLSNNYKIGIQVENNQFRYFVLGEKADIFANNLLNKVLFFPNNRENKDKVFLKYGKIFRYQYTKIDEPISFTELFNRIKDEINKIKLLKNKIEIEIPK